MDFAGRAIVLPLSTYSALAQDADDDAVPDKSSIPYKHVTFDVKGPVTITLDDSCEDSDLVCFVVYGTLKGFKGNVSVYGTYQKSGCEAHGKETCCNTVGDDYFSTEAELGDFSIQYSGLTCSKADSKEKFDDRNVATIDDGSGKGSRKMTDDPETGEGTLSVLDTLRVPAPPPHHRCGSQTCYTKGCCDGGCCFACFPPECGGR